MVPQAKEGLEILEAERDKERYSLRDFKERPC